MDVLPVGWVKTRLGDVCNFINGRAFKVSEWSDEGLPIIRIQNLNNIEAKHNHFPGVVDERHSVIEGDLLFAWSGTPGTSFGAHIWRGGEAVLNQHIFKVVTDQSVVLPGFMKLVFDYNIDFIIDKAQGGVGLKHITRKDLEAIEIAVPRLEVQARILKRLKNVLARIDSSRLELLPCVEQTYLYQAAILRSLYVKGVSASVIGHGAIQLSSVVRDIRYGTSKKSHLNSSGVPVLRIPNIVSGNISTNELKYSEFDEGSLQKLSLEVGDVLIVRSNGSVELVGRSAVVSQEHVGMVYAGYLIRIRPDLSKILPSYLNCMFQAPQVRRQIEQAARSTSGVNNINSTELMNLLIPCPSIADQQNAIDELSKSEIKALALRAELNKVLVLLPNVEKEVMNKIFSGDFVPDDSTEADFLEFSRVVSGAKERLDGKKIQTKRALLVRPSTAIKSTPKKSNSLEVGNALPLTEKLVELGGRAKAKDLWVSSGVKIEDFYKLLRLEIYAGSISIGQDKDILEVVNEA